MISPFAGPAADGTLADAALRGGGATDGAPGAACGAAGAVLAVGAGAGLGAWSRSHACQSMSTEKPNMKSRMSRWVSMSSGHGIAAARMPGTAAANPPQREPAAVPGAVPCERLFRVRRAARVEAAGARQQRSQKPLIGEHGKAK